MKEFVIYTGLRILLFIGSLALLLGAWLATSRPVPVVWAVVVAFVISGIASYFLLDRQRAAFAARVEERATRATAAFDQRRAREDNDN